MWEAQRHAKAPCILLDRQIGRLVLSGEPWMNVERERIPLPCALDIFSSLRGAPVAQRRRGAQEDAVTFGTGQNPVAVLLVLMATRDIIRNEIPGVVQFGRGVDRRD